MPHITIYTSDKLSNEVKFRECFLRLHNLFNQVDSSFDPNSCRSRVVVSDSYLSGTDNSANFIHVEVKIFPGRSSETKTNLINQLTKFFVEIISVKDMKVNFSIELTELNKDFYRKNL